MPTIKFERGSTEKEERDFRVLVDGEHRATFRSNARWRRAGYDLKTADGENIPIVGAYRPIAKADFAEIVRKALAKNYIPTRAEIDRVEMIREAEREDAEHDRLASERR